MGHLMARAVAAVATAAMLLAGGATAAHAQVENRVGAGWGLNSTGQVGDNSFTDRLLPVNAYQLVGVKKVAAGRQHSLAVMNDGTLRTWGANGNWQLGHGVFVHSPVPRQVSGLTGVVDAAGGWTHSLAVTSDGSVWAWGDNQLGQLGDGTTTRRYTPVRVLGLTNAVAVAAGNQWSLALRSDGTVWGWGSAVYGKLGTAVSGSHSGSHSTVPVRVAGLSNVVAVAAGAQHGMAIVAGPSGVRTVHTWGQNAVGQLGGVGLCQGIVCGRATPFQVPGLPSIAAIAAGDLTSVALGTDGSVWTWGSNNSGALGIGSASPGSSFYPVRPVPPGSGVIMVAAGGAHVVAARSNGTATTWGSNQHGELGNGTTTHSLSPVPVSGLTRVRHLAAGWHHTVAVYGQPLTIWPPR